MTVQQRIDFAENVAAAAFLGWWARSKAVGARRGQPPIEAARDLGAPSEILARIEKATAATIAGQPGLAGSDAAVSAFIASTASQSVLSRIIADQLGARLPLDRYLQIGGDPIQAALVDEGFPFVVRGFGGERILLSSRKVATGVVLSDELWQATDAKAQAFVTAQLRLSVATAADDLLFSNIIVSGTLDLEASDEGEARAAFREAMNAVSRAGSNIIFGLGSEAANWLATADLPDRWSPAGGFLLGRPAVVTAGLQPGQVAVLDATKILGSVESIRIEASADATVEMLDNPTNNSVTPTPTTQISLFQTNSVCVRAVLDLAALPIAENPVALITLSEAS